MSWYDFERLEQRQLLSAVRLAVVGDFSAHQPTTDVANLVSSWNPAAVVTVGDNNYPDGSASLIDQNIGQYYQKYIYPYHGTYGSGSPDHVNHFFPALGNHDYDANNAQPYIDYFTLPGNERYYAVQQGNVGIFVVDSNPQQADGTSSTSTQALWLRDSLANSTAKWKLVFFHHPAYSSGISGGASYMRWPFAQWGATAVLAGHDHMYERLSASGLPYFVDGLGGESLDGFGAVVSQSQVRFGSDYGALKVDADDTSIVFQFITRAGQVIDTYTIGSVVGPAAPSNLTATALSASQIKLNWADNATNETSYRIERSTDNINFTEVNSAPADAMTFTDSSLSPGTQYYYRVRAANTGGNSGYSNAASATTQFSNALIATGSAWKYLDNGSNQGTTWRITGFADTTWKSGAAQLGYGDGDEATVVSFGPNSSSKYVTTYFRRTFNVADPSSVSALNLRLLRDDGAVVYLNGTEVFRSNMPTGTIAYNTFASTSIGVPEEQTFYTGTINPALLVAGANTIAVEIHQGDSSSSDVSFDFELTGSFASTSTPPAAPVALVAGVASSTSISLTWQDLSNNETRFLIERSSDGVNFTQVGFVNGNVTAYTDTGLTTGATYYYQVRAFNNAGTSTPTNVAGESLVPPNAPTNLTASSSGTQIQLRWNLVGEAGGFKVERSTDGVNFTRIITSDGEVNGFLDTGLQPATTYYYQVRATNLVGDSAYTNIAGATTGNVVDTTTYLSDLAWLSATNGYGPVEKDHSNGHDGAGDGNVITLNGVTYTKGLGVHADSTIIYNLAGTCKQLLCDVGVDDEEADTATIDFQVFADGVKVFESGTMRATSVTQSISLSMVGVQQLKLVCVDIGDGYTNDHGDWAGARVISGTTPGKPAAPGNLVATAASGSQINLTWADNANNETGYLIERGTDSMNFAQIATAGTNATAYSDTGLTGGVTYFYRVRAGASPSASEYSNIASTTVPIPPAAPTALNAGTGTMQINLTWVDNSTNETGFKIERSIDGVNFIQIAVASVGATTYTDSAVTAGTNYIYRVRAANAAGDSAYTNTASAIIPVASGTVYLSDLAPISSVNGYGPVEKDQSNGGSGAGDGRTITLNGVTYAKGLGVHADSQIVYNLAGAYATFLTDVGVDDEVLDTGTIDIQVLLDGVKVFDSGTMRASSVTQSVNLNVAGVQTLTLIVVDIGDGYTNDHGDWAGARLLPASAPVVPAAPTGLIASAGSATQINLTWADNSGNETGFKIERSTDGVNFTPLATTAADATTFSDSGLASGLKYFYRVRATGSGGDSAYTNIASATTSLPSPWTQGDIGSVGKPGSASNLIGTWTVLGAGSDIANKSDAFDFVYQRLTGDGSIIARVISVQNTNALAKGGIMIRDTLAAGAKHVLVDAKPAGGLEFIRRSSTGGNTTSSTTSGVPGNNWLKLVRSGNTFTAYKSVDAKNWTLIGAVSISMNNQVFIGLAVCSRSTSTLNKSTFDGVQLLGGVVAAGPAAASLFSANKATSNLVTVIA